MGSTREYTECLDLFVSTVTTVGGHNFEERCKQPHVTKCWLRRGGDVVQRARGVQAAFLKGFSVAWRFVTPRKSAKRTTV